jgi:adenylate kinase family enzyme
MSRVAIIGNAGGGKTTLAYKLGKALRIGVHPMDKIQWQPNWRPTPAAQLRRKHTEILAEEKWIIDGWGGWDLITERFEAADTIIFVDFTIALHYWWSFKRQLKSIFIPRSDLPPNCPMLPKTLELFRLMWLVHRQMRPQLRQLIASFEGRKRVIELRSPKDLRRFQREYC